MGVKEVLRLCTNPFLQQVETCAAHHGRLRAEMSFINESQCASHSESKFWPLFFEYLGHHLAYPNFLVGWAQSELMSVVTADLTGHHRLPLNGVERAHFVSLFPEGCHKSLCSAHG